MNENENVAKFCKTIASRITDPYLHFYFVSGACWKNVNLRKMQSTLIYCMPFHDFAYERACKHEKKVKENRVAHRTTMTDFLSISFLKVKESCAKMHKIYLF